MRSTHGVLLSAALILATVSVASGQVADPKASAGASSNTRSEGSAGVQNQSGQSQIESATDVKAAAAAEATLRPIRDRAKNAPAKAREALEKKLDEISTRIDNEVTEHGDVAVAGRLAPDFNVTVESIMSERSELAAGMGELMIAHTFMASSKTHVTPDQVFSLYREGLGWGQIAYGLGLKLSEVATA